MSLPDPFAEWNNLNPTEPYNLDQARRDLAALVPEPGHWKFPASLSRFGTDRMNARQLRSFTAKVNPQMIDWKTPCWLWMGGTHDKGYGRFYLGRDPDTSQRIWAYSHRISFEHFVGMPPAGYIVDHQCNHKLCCNPAHLWPETNNNNLRLADQRRPWKRRNQYSHE